MRWRCSRKISADRRAISSSRSLGMASGSSPEGAAEDRRAPPLRRAGREQREDRGAARVVALVSARGRDATAEQEALVTVIDDRLAGGRGAEAARLLATVGAREGDAGDRRRPPPEGRLLPVLGQAGPLHEEHVRDQNAREVRHQPVELLEARARAGAARMQEHHQRRDPGDVAETASGGPVRWRRGRHPGGILVVPEDGEARGDGKEPRGAGYRADQTAAAHPPASGTSRASVANSSSAFTGLET